MLGVLHVIVPEPDGEIGGADLHVRDLAVQQSQTADVAPVILATLNRVFRAELAETGIPLLDVGRHTSLASAFLATRAARIPDQIALIHAHGYDANYLVYALRLALTSDWRRLPVVITCHGWLRSTISDRIKTLLDFWTHSIACQIIVTSQTQLQELPPRSRKKATYIPNGVDIARFRSVPSSAPATYPTFTYIGRLAAEKRPDLFIHAAKLISERIGDAQFLLVGSGKMQSYLRELASDLNLDSRIRFLGLVHDVNQVLATTTCLIVPSDTEGTPRVIIEALASGTPVVATNVGGIPQLVDSTVGALVEPNNAHSLAHAAIQLAIDHTAYKTMADMARARAQRDFTSKTMAQRTLEVYRRVAD